MSADTSRRRFLKGATAAGSLLAAKTVLLESETAFAAPGPTAAGDRVRFGMIGIGMQGSNLLRDSISLPGVECVGAADLWDGRHTLAPLPGAIRSCWRARTSIASSPLCPTIGTSAWWWMPAMPARTSTARSP